MNGSWDTWTWSGAADPDRLQELVEVWLPGSSSLEADAAGAARLTAWVGSDRVAAAEELLRALDDAGLPAPERTGSARPVDWSEAWREHHDRIRPGSRLVFTPPWKGTPGPDEIVLEPGMAFGMGDHATTSMCVDLLEGVVKPGDRVLDVGSGSGILALAAWRLGAPFVTACDIDPNSVAAMLDNRDRNAAEGAIHVFRGSLDGARGTFDVIVANIVAPVLIPMLDGFRTRLGPGGFLVLSGVSDTRTDGFERALADGRWEIRERRARGGYHAVVAGRAGDC